ncbi:hypothetical protein J7I93_13705 [Bacillus sp. ISL-47]|uniref:hypothetical protein n=1 Tax=Bacillus sp. ISL-47 TaxID=2819130 RepID=UPI001BEB8B0C|nr:hypothetical protein [Bacillus sp. ISL-47]MBT2689242.1 hypothetical protein [Bacillus sp. ISL-47]MBT2708633.1 hypothetical protein [Pseudomonas sp. ISL-84]
MSNLKPLTTVIPKAKASLSPEAAMLAGSGVEVIGQVITAMKDYSIAKEQEKTQREHIQSMLEVGLKRLQNDRANFQDFLKVKHTERMDLYKSLQEGMKIAISNGDIQMLQTITDMIKFLYSENAELKMASGKHE